MKLYNTDTITQKDKIKHHGEKSFLKQVEVSGEGYRVVVDDLYDDIPMIIQRHTNPLNKNLHDMKAKYLDSTGDIMHIGNVILIKDNKPYMAITEPFSNGVYSEYKIIPLTDDFIFNNVEIKCAMANKGFYDESSFVNDSNVFEDKKLKAAIIQYNDDTSKLSLFDNVTIDGTNYQIVKIDDHTFKGYDKDYGVLQLVVLDTPYGEIKCSNGETLRGVILTARVKDKILNSISRELICCHNKVKRGDYVEFTYDRDNKGTMATETYLTINKPTMGDGYDTSLLYLCESTTKLINGIGEVVTVPLYYENNRTRIDKVTENQNISIKGSSYLVMMQNNELNKNLTYNVNRIMINSHAYKVTGFDDLSEGVLSLGLEIDQLTSDDNIELGVANYYSQMKKYEPTTGDIDGKDTLYLNYANTYVLNAPNVCTWSTSEGNVKVTDLGGNKCEVLCADTSMLNKTIKLYAKIGTYTYEKSIKIKMI